ncbi:RNA polymerase sigma factor [Bradyrhizobium sp. ARR65]|uniref:RNA polymerase sigma factor n=1 Tax=Bradyrhizobium sp. ARR65 TaxID=1040989 RepID=UPI0004632FFE|nr:RNA polymerase sigma factor [Bradyrhizobium sp. ARR65]
MGRITWGALRDLLADHYDDFRLRLTRRLGSEELASESLHETWLRLDRQGDVGAVQSPAAYLMRVALNIATDRRRTEARWARRSDPGAAGEVPDTAPGPAREVEGRLDLKVLQRAIDRLPERTREILTAARLDGLSQQEIAERFAISTRMVRIELRRALDLCEAAFKHETITDFLSTPSESSMEGPDGSRSAKRGTTR